VKLLQRSNSFRSCLEVERVDPNAFFSDASEIARDEIIEVAAFEGVFLEREVLMGAEVVDPEFLGPGFFSAAGLRSKKSTLAFTPWA